MELIEGREVENAPPKEAAHPDPTVFHCVPEPSVAVRSLARPELNVLTGGVTTDGRREYIVPDLVVVDRSVKYEGGSLAEPPIWGVEILSPGQTIGALFTRAERLLHLGTPLVWVIWPERRKEWELSSSDLQEAQHTLTAWLPKDGDDAVSTEVPLGEMWAELDS